MIIGCALISVALMTPARIDADDPPAVKKFSPEVVAKATSILEAANLRRAGNRWELLDIGSVGRDMSDLGRDKRLLRRLHDDWQNTNNQVVRINRDIRALSVTRGQLSLQLAQVRPGDTITNNRIVGMLNANKVGHEQMVAHREQLETSLAEKRSALNTAEAQYTTTVLAIRDQLDTMRNELQTKLDADDVQTAMRVMQVNEGAAPNADAADVMMSLSKRFEKIEQEVFREEIQLQRSGDTLLANVIIGATNISMVVDSGAEVVCLPAATANELGIQINAENEAVNLILADGRTIGARRVVIPKMRVGSFVAENVEAAVMDASAIAAIPLLGMSYLRQFRYEIDAVASTLKMTRVEAE